MININRDTDGNDPDWGKVDQDTWRKFDDSHVDSASFKDLAGHAFGGDATKDDSAVSSVQYGWGKSVYMLVYERKSKRAIRQVKEESKEISKVEWVQIPAAVPEWINKMVKQELKEKLKESLMTFSLNDYE